MLDAATVRSPTARETLRPRFVPWSRFVGDVPGTPLGRVSGLKGSLTLVHHPGTLGASQG